MNITLRRAIPDDAGQLLAIYTPYVENTAITFECEVPSLQAFESRIKHIIDNYPYIVAEADGDIVGYAYTGSFVGRTAYIYSAETTIYVKEDHRKSGVGRRLYQTIENISKAQNIIALYACIGYTEEEDEYLTNNSTQFHAHLGYHTVGTFRKCGRKFNRWYDMIWMEKLIGEHTDSPKPFVPFAQLNENLLNKLLK